MNCWILTIMNSEFAFEENSRWLLANISEINGRYFCSRVLSDAENSTVLADSKLISIFRQSKQETQFIKICSETQKAIPEKNFWGSCVFSPCFYKLRASSRGFFLWGEVPCFLLFNYFLNNSAKLRYNLAVYPCDCSHTQYYNCYFCSATKLQSNLD